MHSRQSLLRGALFVILASVPLMGRAQDGPGGLDRKEYDLGQILGAADEPHFLEHLIMAVLHPEEWDDVGGAGTISVAKANGLVLVVRQTAAIHGEIASLLDVLSKMPRRKQHKPAAKGQPPKQIAVTLGKADAEGLIVAVYDVADLVPTGNYAALVFPIRQLDPTTWNSVGGPGACAEFPPSKALVILQTDAGHRQVRDWLTLQRKKAAAN